MLKKLLKYDLENIFKFLTIFYVLSILFGILTRIFLSIENSFIINIIGKICSGATISMVFNIIINILMRSWIRFKNNLYGDESYLTHTLPVEKKTIYLSKILTSIISLFVSVLVIGITLFIAYYSKENIEIVKNLLLPLANIYDSTIINILLAFLFVFFLEFASAIQSGYSGIILGHRMNNGKTGFSVLFGFIVYIIFQILTILIIFIIALFNPDLMNLFITNEMIDINMVKNIIIIATVIYTINLILGYILNIKLFKSGVNVD